MQLLYEINGQFVTKNIFTKSLPDTSELIVWDHVISSLFNEIKVLDFNIILKYEDGGIRLISETNILYKLLAENLKMREAIALNGNLVTNAKVNYGKALASI